MIQFDADDDGERGQYAQAGGGVRALGLPPLC
jgi:hypothetical protein